MDFLGETLKKTVLYISIRMTKPFPPSFILLS